MNDLQIQIIALLLIAILGIQIVQARSLIRIRRRLRALHAKTA